MADLDPETFAKLQDLLKDTDPSKTPSRKELLEMLEVVDFSEDVKENLRAMLTGDVPKVFGANASGTYLAILFVFLVFTLIVFFGYKLYKSLKEKEIKREEKKKAKQMKKKK